jgi:hypothetical protein
VSSRVQPSIPIQTKCFLDIGAWNQRSQTGILSVYLSPWEHT